MLKKLLRTCALGLGLACIAPSAFSAAPPLTLVVPFEPGGGSDLFARLLAPALGRALNENVIVENKAGAGGIIGAELVMRSRPQDNMLLVSDSAIYTMIPSLYKNLPFTRKDLTPVANLALFGNVLVVPESSRFQTMQDMLAAARKAPGTITIASSGIGAATHLTAEKLMEQANIKLVHVPYKGTGPAMADTVGGHVDMMFTGLPAALTMLNSHKLRALGIATLQRAPEAPSIPTISESGVPQFTSMISQGLFAPRSMSAKRVEELNAIVVKIMHDPDMQKKMQQLLISPVYWSNVEYQKWLDQEADSWGALIKRDNITVE